MTRVWSCRTLSHPKQRETVLFRTEALCYLSSSLLLQQSLSNTHLFSKQRLGKDEHAGEDCFTFYRERMDSDSTTLDKEPLCANNWSLPRMMMGLIFMSISAEICSQSLDIPDSCNQFCSDRKINCQLASSDVLRSTISKQCCPDICHSLTLPKCQASMKASHSPSPAAAGQMREKFNRVHALR